MPRAAATTELFSSESYSPRAGTAGRVRSPRRGRTPRVQPAVPLGSLTQPGARGGATCAACGSERVTSLRMTLTDGTPVSFTSCHRCEHRTWSEMGGDDLPVAKVLKKARKPR